MSTLQSEYPYNLPDDVTQADVDRAAWDSDEPFELGPVDVVALQEILDGLMVSVADEESVCD